MATSDDTGVESTAYGGGGAGGKFRKKPLRKSHRPTTPYDRPLTVQKGNINPNLSNNNGGLFTRFVLDPASKLISYGAHRFFASVFRKRLPPPPLQELEVNGELGNVPQVPVPNYEGEIPRGDASTQPLHSSPYGGTSELEQLFKQKTFSRSEINHLTELLKSRAVIEVSPVLDPPANEETATYIGRRQPFSSSPLEREIKEGALSRGVVPTSFSNSRVIDNDMASPAELAKAYMGARPSKISPTRNQLGREDFGLLGSTPFSSKFPILPLTGKTSVATEDGYLTPKFRGRSAIYNMARTPYSRVHLLRDNKGTIVMNNGYGRQSVPSSSHSGVEHNEKSDAKTLALKRRSSVLDDDIGSAGPVRKIRPKLNLLGSRTPGSLHGVGSVSDFLPASSSQIYPVTVYPNKRFSRITEKNENDGFRNESYTHVPSKSSEVAAKILEHLENLTPKEKSSESKLVNGRHKSPFQLTHGMRKGQPLGSIEDADSSELLLSVLDDPKVEDRSTLTLLPTQDSVFEQQEKLKENTRKEFSDFSNMLNPVMKNEFVMSPKGHVPSNGTPDAAIRISLTQLPETKKAFRMSAQEDLSEQVDDGYLFELASRPLMEGKELAEATLAGDKLSVPPKMVLPVGPCEKVSAGTVVIDESSGNIPLSPENANAGIQSKVLHPTTLSPKEDRVSDSLSFLRSSSDTAGRIPPFLSNSGTKKPESILENSISLVDVSKSANSQLEIAVPEQGRHLNPLKIGDANRISHTFPSTSLDGPHLLKPALKSFTTSPCNETHVSTASSGFFTSSNVSSFGSLSTNAAGSTSTSLTGSGSASTSIPITFGVDTAGSKLAPSVFGGPIFKFGNSVDPSTTASTASASASTASASASTASASASGLADLKSNSVKQTKFGSSNGTYSAAANPGSSPSGSDMPVSFSPADNLKGSCLGNANESAMACYGTGLNSSIQFGSLAAFPSLSTSSAAFLGTSSSNELNPSPIFGTSGSHGNPVGSSSGAAPAIFSFGLGSSASTSTSASNNGNTLPVFSFGGNSLPLSLISSTGFNSSSIPSSNPVFSFTAASSPSPSSSPLSFNQPMFGNKLSGFTASPGNSDQMNAEDSMAEDPVQPSTPIPVFGQPSVSPSPPGFIFGSTVPSPMNPFQFSSQQNQIAPQNLSPFQASGSLEFNAGGSFSLGSAGTDKSTRKFVKVNRNKNRKK